MFNKTLNDSKVFKYINLSILLDLLMLRDLIYNTFLKDI